MNKEEQRKKIISDIMELQSQRLLLVLNTNEKLFEIDEQLNQLEETAVDVFGDHLNGFVRHVLKKLPNRIVE